MDRKNLLIASSITGVILVLLSIGIFISLNSTNNTNSTVISNSNDNTTTENNITFNNSTSEAAAISIARLNEGAAGFGEGNGITTNASLTSDGKYWIVHMHEEGYDSWVVTIDAKTLISKKMEVWKNL